MEQGSLLLNSMDFSYREIGEVLLGILRCEQEPLEEFLSDILEYEYAEVHEARHVREAGNHCAMEACPEFEKLVRIVHSYVLECQRSHYLETGFNSYASLTVSEFLEEIFKRYRS